MLSLAATAYVGIYTYAAGLYVAPLLRVFAVLALATRLVLFISGFIFRDSLLSMFVYGLELAAVGAVLYLCGNHFSGLILFVGSFFFQILSSINREK